jgi:hypothetical protein
MGHYSFMVSSEKHRSSCFLFVGHYKFVNLSMRHRTVSSRQKKLKKLSSNHCAVSQTEFMNL